MWCKQEKKPPEQHRGGTCGAGTLRASSLSRSRALTMINGSQVFRVVRTVMDPSTCTHNTLVTNTAHQLQHRQSVASNTLCWCCRKQLASHRVKNPKARTRLSSHATPTSFSAFVIAGQTSRRYFSATPHNKLSESALLSKSALLLCERLPTAAVKQDSAHPDTWEKEWQMSSPPEVLSGYHPC